MRGLCAYVYVVSLAILAIGSQALKLNQQLKDIDDGNPFGKLMDKVKGAKNGADGWLKKKAVDNSHCVIPQGFHAVSVLNGTSLEFKMVVYAGRDIFSQLLWGQGWNEIKAPEDVAYPTGKPLPLSPSGEKGVFLDLGANLGYYSLLFAIHGHKVIAVEPMTKNRAALNATLCLNPELKKRITLVPAALVSQKDQGMRCVIRSSGYYPFLGKNVTNDGDGCLTCGPPEKVQLCTKNERFVCDEPQVKTLDQVLKELSPKSIDIVKMDVEGFECNVFEGGQSLFKKYRPKLLKVETLSNDTIKCVAQMAAQEKYITRPSYPFDTLMSLY